MQSWLPLLLRLKFSFFSSLGELDILPLHQLSRRFNQGAGCDHMSLLLLCSLRSSEEV